MKRLVVVGAVTLAGCQWIPGTDEHLREQAQQLAAAQLIDPSSAQFRRVEVSRRPGGDRVCGEINGKNRMGAYVGFTRFVTDLEGGGAWLEPIEDIGLGGNDTELAHLERTLFKMRAIAHCPPGWSD